MLKAVFHYFALIQLLLLQAFIFKTKTYYEDDKKQNRNIKGKTIIISNHRSFMDGIVIFLKYFFTRIHFISIDFFKNKRNLLKLLVISSGGIFIEEDGRGLSFIDKSRKAMEKNRPILIFPEGSFKFTYEPSDFSQGYILFAIKMKAQIVPIVNDFNYGLFKRVHLMIGNSIDLSNYSNVKLTKEKRTEINDEISRKYLMLFYKLKKKKAERFSNKYELASPQKGNIIRVEIGSHHHYGVYLSPNEVIQFGHAENKNAEDVVVNSVSLRKFCGSNTLEVRTFKKSEKRFIRSADDIEKYARSCIGQGGYNIECNNDLDFANRVTLKI